MPKWVRFSMNNFKEIKNKDGLYAIFYKKKLMYIGTSKEIRQRLRGHGLLRPWVDKRNIEIAMKYIRESRWRIEEKLVKRLTPPLNGLHETCFMRGDKP